MCGERLFVVDTDQSGFRLIFNGLAHIELASRACPDAAYSGASAFRIGRQPGNPADQAFRSTLYKRVGTRALCGSVFTSGKPKLKKDRMVVRGAALKNPLRCALNFAPHATVQPKRNDVGGAVG